MIYKNIEDLYICIIYIHVYIFNFFLLSVTDGNLRHSTRSLRSYYSAEMELCYSIVIKLLYN